MNEEKIIDLLEQILKEVKATKSPVYGPINDPTKVPLPWTPKSTKQSCTKCGITLEPIMGYYCPHSDCPCGLGSPSC